MCACALVAESAHDGPAAGKPAVLAAAEKVETGEEGERTVFAGDGTLFSFDTAGWRERGRGELRVKVDRSGAPTPVNRWHTQWPAEQRPQRKGGLLLYHDSTTWIAKPQLPLTSCLC